MALQIGVEGLPHVLLVEDSSLEDALGVGGEKAHRPGVHLIKGVLERLGAPEFQVQPRSVGAFVKVRRRKWDGAEDVSSAEHTVGPGSTVARLSALGIAVDVRKGPVVEDSHGYARFEIYQDQISDRLNAEVFFFAPGRALSLHTERADASQTHLGRANY